MIKNIFILSNADVPGISSCICHIIIMDVKQFFADEQTAVLSRNLTVN